MGNNKTRTRKARRATKDRRIEGVPLADGGRAYTVCVAPFLHMLDAVAVHVGGRLTSVPESALLAAWAWMANANGAAPGERPLCLSCAREYTGLNRPIDALSHLVFIEGGDDDDDTIAVIRLCGECGKGKSEGEIRGIVNDYCQAHVGGDDVEISVGPPRDGGRRH